MLDLMNSLSDPAAIDGEALARLTTVDTQANVASVAAQRKKETAEAAASGPQPEIKIDPISGTVTAKNVPLKSFQQQTQDAEAKPWAQYAEGLKSSIDQARRVRESLPDPEGTDIDQKMQTPEGRKALARELGIQPDFVLGHGALKDYIHAHHAIGVLSQNPDRFKSMVAATRLKNRLDIDKEASQPFHELVGTAQAETRDQREARSQENQGVRETMSAIHGMDLTGFKDPGEAVDTMSKLFPEAAKREGFGEAVTAAHHAQSVALQRKNLETQLAEARSERDEKKTNAILGHLATVDASIGQQMNVRNQEHQILGQDDIKSIVDAQDRGVDKSQLPPLNGYQALQVMRYREANHRELIPALRPQAADALTKNDAIRVTTADLRSAIEAFRSSPYWNMPFDQLPNKIKYQIGMASPDQIGKLQSKFQIESWAGSMALVRGMRNGQIIQEVREHLPVFGKDSLALMDDKLSNADDYYQANENAAKKYGAKSGIITNPASVQAPAQGGTEKPDPLGIRKYLRH